MITKLKTWIEKRKLLRCHRQLLVISGSKEWVNKSFQDLISIAPPSSKVCIGDIDKEENINNQQYKTVLGQEFEWVVYDGFQDLRGNALLALSGCVSKSGLMILLCPSLEEWSVIGKTQNYTYQKSSKAPVHQSPFIHWLVQHIQTFHDVSVWQQNQGKLPIAEHNKLMRSTFEDNDCKTADQYQLVEYLKSVQDTRNNQIVVRADRGRGKSSALGLAAGHMIASSNSTILVTSAHVSMTEQIFKQATRILSRSTEENSQFAFCEKRLNYLAFDLILKSTPTADWLFIDEAASLPTEILEKLVNSYPNVVLSTTTHGYEGSGRGFELRFKPFLKAHFNQYREFVLHTPIRWYEGDPLEAFWNRVMALKPLPRKTAVEHHSTQHSSNTQRGALEYRVYTGEQLITSPELLNSVFTLLIDAHYQTTPDDLVRMLDGNQQVHILSNGASEPIAVALTTVEGGDHLSPIALNIAQGNRRIPGHLIPQRLTFDHCKPEYLLERYMRIIRIAVTGQHRQNSIGSRLIEYILALAEQSQIAFVGSSFGLTSDLYNFWHKNGFHLVKLGIKQDASSGEFSAIMLNPLTAESVDTIKKLSLLCQQQISFQRKYRIRNLDKNLVDLVLIRIEQFSKEFANESATMTLYWQLLISEFIKGNRPLFSVEFAIYNLLKQQIKDYKANSISLNTPWEFINDVIFEKLNYAIVSEKYKLAGKKQIEKFMREQLGLINDI